MVLQVVLHLLQVVQMLVVMVVMQYAFYICAV
jgi:hypothetical protein